MDPSNLVDRSQTPPSMSKRVRYGCKICADFKPSSRNFNAERHVWVQHVRDSHPDHSRAAYEPYMFKQFVKEHVAILRPGADEDLEFQDGNYQDITERQTEANRGTRVRWVDMSASVASHPSLYDRGADLLSIQHDGRPPHYYEQFSEYERPQRREYYNQSGGDFPPSETTYSPVPTRRLVSTVDDVQMRASRSLQNTHRPESPNMPPSSMQFPIGTQRVYDMPKDQLSIARRPGDARYLQRPMGYDFHRSMRPDYEHGPPARQPLAIPHQRYTPYDEALSKPAWFQDERRRPSLWASSSEDAIRSEMVMNPVDRPSMQHPNFPTYTGLRNPGWHTIQQGMNPPTEVAKMRDTASMRDSPLLMQRAIPQHQDTPLDDMRTGSRDSYPHQVSTFDSFSAPHSKDNLRGQMLQASPPNSRRLQRDMLWNWPSHTARTTSWGGNSARYDREYRQKSVSALMSPKSAISDPCTDRTGAYMPSPTVSPVRPGHRSISSQWNPLPYNEDAQIVDGSVSSHGTWSADAATKSTTIRTDGISSASEVTLPVSEQSSDNPSNSNTDDLSVGMNRARKE